VMMEGDNTMLDQISVAGTARAMATAAILAIGAGLPGGPAAAQDGIVADRTDVVKTLSEKHGESAQALGLASNGGVFELFTSLDGATWTIIMTMPNGKSSLVGEGKVWVKARTKPKGQPI